MATRARCSVAIGRVGRGGVGRVSDGESAILKTQRAHTLHYHHFKLDHSGRMRQAGMGRGQ